jgi:hypothetical protein
MPYTPATLFCNLQKKGFDTAEHEASEVCQKQNNLAGSQIAGGICNSYCVGKDAASGLRSLLTARSFLLHHESIQLSAK